MARHHRPTYMGRPTSDFAGPRRKQARPARYLLTGLVYSPEGAKMTGARAKGKPGEYNRRIYKCPGVSVDADHLEAFVVEYVLAHTDRASLPRGKGVPRVSSDVADLERELEQLAALRGKGTISLREWMAAKSPSRRAPRGGTGAGPGDPGTCRGNGGVGTQGRTTGGVGAKGRRGAWTTTPAAAPWPRCSSG